MKTFTSAAELQQIIIKEKSNQKSVGYVATMGFLHEGHATLLENARKENDIVVLSIFVNPLQFGPNEDFETYPRDLERDENVAANAGVDYLFYPTVNEMYGEEPSVKVVVQSRTECLCGRQRPGHFDGVATVLTKFFNIILPDRAYFGKKDAQQVAVIDGLIQDFNFPIKLVAVDTVREEDGLAKSSRNVYLLDDERIEAKELYQSLLKAIEAINTGERNPNTITALVREHVEAHTNGKIDYIEVYQYPELKPIETLSGNIIIAMAVKFKHARLIDNITLTVE
ncbi:MULTISPECIES: pantoate--beta-alanine ligase [unclassified Peribacillus]|uniref:pantoate--beta-alanine ligase n=1 Tax=unclassified Peribacillus TaxID=2675266 RepID=UPI0019115BBC|nr:MULTISPECIES: pantoate--beta-alanine ligase [unclassified Peribacillus]MBK5462918.1 pantoate--beta-alanine ligase [Peribacillus sp. TH27]MBK5483739.1 pantoate--beta-alanine ligase [Peribacillus sp. TH16]MBK5501103.1 pantoate--beta-alanine ligase [Peribacillus sp. TH14]WMX53930.1 pantoate--beta-alanine ligase [Peribacillus sp. R9-11]